MTVALLESDLDPDVAQILLSEVTGEETAPVPPDSPELKEQTSDYLNRATPLLSRKEGAGQDSLLLIPASAAGKQLGEAIAALFPDVKFVRVPGQSDLMFLREQSSLSAADLAANTMIREGLRPMTSTRSDNKTASRMLCVTNSTVLR